MGNSFEVYNPYEETIVGYAPEHSVHDVKKIVERTHKRKIELDYSERAVFLRKVCSNLENKKTMFSKLITSESGLCIKQTRHEVSRTLEVLEASAEVAEELEDKPNTDVYMSKNAPLGAPTLEVITEPLELIAGITPFNHPLNLVAHKCCPAIAANSPMILKPSEKTPLTAIKFLELLEDSGLPSSFVGLATSKYPEKIVKAIVKSEKTKLVSFTGGHNVGMKIGKFLSDRRTPIQYVCELSGNSALTILEDADLEKAADVAMGAFDNSGQRCTSIKRVIVQDEVADDFLDLFTKNTENFKCGAPSDLSVDIGTLIDKEAAINVENAVKLALDEGASLVHGHERQGAQYSPTILDNVNPLSRLVSSETFGPVAPIIRVKDSHEAIKIILSSEYRLAGAIMTQSRAKAKSFANSIGVGQFNWNGPPGYRTEKAPFGGFGLSGNGLKEGVVDTVRNYRKVRTFYTH